MKPNLGIPEDYLQAVSIELNRLLADEVVVYIKTRNYHWNNEGPNFQEMHNLYENQFGQIEEIMDHVAERIRIIGHYAEARLADYLKLTNLVEDQSTSVQNDQLKRLLAAHETIINNLHRLATQFVDAYKDIGSSDFVTQLLGRHEKMAWTIRAYLS